MTNCTDMGTTNGKWRRQTARAFYRRERRGRGGVATGDLCALCVLCDRMQLLFHIPLSLSQNRFMGLRTTSWQQ